MSNPTRRISIYIDHASAERAYDKLKKKQDEYTAAIKKGESAGKNMSDAWNKLADTRKEMQGLADVISGKVAPSFKQVGQHVRTLERELKGMSESAPGYAAKFAKFKEVQAHFEGMRKKIREVQSAMNESGGGGFFSRMGDQIKAFSLGTFAGNTIGNAIDMVRTSISKMVGGNYQLSDSMSSVAQTTGMTRKEIRELDKDLRNINTRTTQEELLKIAKIGGQFNVPKEEMKDFVETMNKTSVVLSSEFGGGVEQVTDEMSLLRNVFADIKSGKISDDIAKISNSVVTLAQEGSATGPVITDFAKRLSPLISTANLSSGAILGMGAAMQEMAINPERGATAMIRIFSEMTDNIGAFSKVAGMTKNEFRQLLKEDAMGGFIKVLEGFKKGGNNVVELNGLLKDLELNGIGAKEVLVKMSAETGLLTDRVDLASKALTNTTAITQQYAEKNDNAIGIVEKLGRKMLSYFVNSGTEKGIEGITQQIGILGGVVTEASLAFSDFQQAKKSVEDLERSMPPLISRYEELNAKAMMFGGTVKLSKEEQDELQNIITKVGDAIPYAIERFDQYGNAMSLSTTRAREFIQVQRDALKEMNRDALLKAENRRYDLQADKTEEERKLRQAQKLYKDYKDRGFDSHRLEEKSTQIYDLSRNVRSIGKELIEVESSIVVMGGHVADQTVDMVDVVTFGIQKGMDKTADAGVEAVKAVGDAGKNVMQEVTDVTLMSGAAIREELKELKKAATGTDTERIKELALELKKRTGTGGFRKDPDIAKKATAEASLKRILSEIENLGAETEAKMRDLQKGDGKDHEKEVQVLAERFDRTRQALEKLGPKYVDTAAALAGLNAEETKALKLLMSQQEKERTDAEYVTSIKNLKNFYEQKKQATLEAYAGNVIDEREKNAQLKKLEADEAKDRVTVIEDYAPKVKQAQDDLESAKTDAVRKGVSDRKFLTDSELDNAIYKAQREVVIAKNGSKEQTEAKLELLKAQFDKETALMDEQGEQYKMKLAEYDKAIDQVMLDSWMRKVNMVMQGLQMMVGAMQQYFEMLNTQENAVLAKEKQNVDKKKALYDRQLQQKLISQEEYNKKVETLDENYRKRENAAKKKQFQRNKAVAYAEAVINAAQAVTQIWAQYAGQPIVAAVLTGIAAAATGLKIATIAKQKYVEYARGGIAPVAGKGGRPNGPSHAGGGIGLYDSSGNKIGEMEGGEPIISNEAYANNKAAVDAILDSGRNRGGQFVDLSHLYAQPKSISYRKATETFHSNRFYNEGGGADARRASSAGSNISAGAGSDPEMKLILSKLLEHLDNGLYATTDIIQQNKMQKTYDRLRKYGSLGG